MSTNGADLGHIAAMLQQVIATLGTHTRLLDEHTLRFHALDRRVDGLAGDVKALREAVVEYHGSVVGHGILISELDQRVGRIERHLDLPGGAAHG